MRRPVVFLLTALCVLLPRLTAAGRDGVRSAALIGGPVTLSTNDKGQLRFPTLPPGS